MTRRTTKCGATSSSTTASKIEAALAHADVASYLDRSSPPRVHNGLDIYTPTPCSKPAPRRENQMPSNYQPALAGRFARVTDPTPGLRVHVEGWSKGAVFIVELVGIVTVSLRTPKSHRLYFADKSKLLHLSGVGVTDVK